MYNEKLKVDFVRSYTNSVHTESACRILFDAVEKYENKWNADICTKKEEELLPVIEELVGLRAKSKHLRLLILKEYVKWCISNDVPGACDDILNINDVGVGKIRQQTVSSPLHLQKYLNEICEPEDEQTVDNIYRCYYWLAYAGIYEDDILNIRCDDVDFSRMVIKYNGIEVPIYREAVLSIKNCIELTQFVYKHPNYSANVYKDRVPGDTLIRGIRSQLSIKSMRVELSRRSKRMRDSGATELKLSHFRVWISGLFYRTYELELMGVKPDFKAIVSQQKDGKVYKLGSRNTQEYKKKQLAHDFLNDYQRWKLAFKI